MASSGKLHCRVGSHYPLDHSFFPRFLCRLCWIYLEKSSQVASVPWVAAMGYMGPTLGNAFEQLME